MAKDILARRGQHILPREGWVLRQSSSYGKGSKGEFHDVYSDVMAIMALKSFSSLPFITVVVCNEQGKKRTCKALLDTGASANFISKNVAEWLVASGSVPIPVNKNIADGFKSASALCERGMSLNVEIFTEVKEPPVLQARIDAWELDLNFEVILGVHTVMQCPSVFMSSDKARRVADVVGDNAFPLARERDDQSGGAVSPSLGVHASYPRGGERASVRLPLRKNYDLEVREKLAPLEVGISDKGEDWSYSCFRWEKIFQIYQLGRHGTERI